MSNQWVEKVSWDGIKYREMQINFEVMDTKGRLIGAVAKIRERNASWRERESPECPIAVLVQATRDGKEYGASQSYVYVQTDEEAMKVISMKVEGARKRVLAKAKKNTKT